jgi:Ca2+-binding EF-hand superfamily protein
LFLGKIFCTIKTKDEKINLLQELLSKKEKIVSLMSRDFKRVNKKKEAVINYEEFESMVSEHGGKLEERKLINGKQQIEALQKEFELRPGAFKELFDDMDVDDSGGVDLDEFRDAFAERAELWGYGEAFSSARTKELGLFEAIDVDKDSSISWVEFERYLTNEKNKKQNSDLKTLKLNELMICRGIYKRNPIKPGINFINSVDSLFCYTKISNSGPKQEIKHIWYLEGIVMTSVAYNIKPSKYQICFISCLGPELDIFV